MKTNTLKAIPCENCGKVLCKGNISVGQIEIKCTRCGQINSIKPHTSTDNTSKWETVNTSTTANVLNMQICKSKDWTEIIHKNKL